MRAIAMPRRVAIRGVRCPACSDQRGTTLGGSTRRGCGRVGPTKQRFASLALIEGSTLGARRSASHVTAGVTPRLQAPCEQRVVRRVPYSSSTTRARTCERLLNVRLRSPALPRSLPCRAALPQRFSSRRIRAGTVGEVVSPCRPSGLRWPTAPPSTSMQPSGCSILRGAGFLRDLLAQPSLPRLAATPEGVRAVGRLRPHLVSCRPARAALVAVALPA